MTATSTPGERARALFAVLKRKDLIPEGYIEQLTQLMEHGWSPENGARIVAKACRSAVSRATAQGRYGRLRPVRLHRPTGRIHRRPGRHPAAEKRDRLQPVLLHELAGAGPAA